MIEVRDLVYRYDDRNGEDSGEPGRASAVLRGIDLSIPDGQFLVLAGPNGSGKTTLVRQFNGLLEPDAGEVRVNGTRVSEDPLAARSTVGMTFQHPRDSFVASAVRADVAFGPENLGLGRDEIDRRVAQAIEAVGMSGREDDRLDRLSGGEQTRVAIAGALAMEPAVLVLDEPFAGLDWPARERLLDHLAALQERGTGVIVVTHDLTDLLPLAERVVVLANGQVAADGPPETVRTRLADLGVREPPPIES